MIIINDCLFFFLNMKFPIIVPVQLLLDNQARLETGSRTMLKVSNKMI